MGQRLEPPRASLDSSHPFLIAVQVLSRPLKDFVAPVS